MQNKCYLIIICSLFLLVSFTSFAQLIYVSPSPGSKFQNPETGIILRSRNSIDASSLSKKNLIQIEGSISGVHDFKMKLVQDNRTIILHPTEDFAEGETITVSIGNEIRLKSGEKIQGTSFQF